jgi:hypothetical protein
MAPLPPIVYKLELSPDIMDAIADEVRKQIAVERKKFVEEMVREVNSTALAQWTSPNHDH